MPATADAFQMFPVSRPPIRKADIEFTSRCNLRCTYCTVSLPGDVGEDMPADRDAQLLSDLKSLGVTHVTLNGRGETTFVKDWVRRITPFVDAFETRIISNFARALTEEELQLLARIDRIDVSIDSLDKRVMASIRRRVNPDVIIANIVRVRVAALHRGLPLPRFTFGTGIYDRNVSGLPDLARLAVQMDIAEVNFWNLVKHEDVPDGENVMQVNDLPLPAQFAALAAMEEAGRILGRAGIPAHFAGDTPGVLRAALASTVAAA